MNLRPAPTTSTSVMRATCSRSYRRREGSPIARMGRSGMPGRPIRQPEPTRDGAPGFRFAPSWLQMPRLCRAKQLLEFAPEHRVALRQRCRDAEIGQAGDAVARIGHAAGHDAGEMREVRRDVERNAM